MHADRHPILTPRERYRAELEPDAALAVDATEVDALLSRVAAEDEVVRPVVQGEGHDRVVDRLVGFQIHLQRHAVARREGASQGIGAPVERAAEDLDLSRSL